MSLSCSAVDEGVTLLLHIYMYLYLSPHTSSAVLSADNKKI